MATTGTAAVPARLAAAIAKADGEGSAYQYCGGDPVGQVDPSGAYVVKHYPIWSRVVSWKDIPKSDVLRYVAWFFLGNSYAFLQSQPTRRMDVKTCAYRQRLVWWFSGADIVGALPAFKVAAKTLPWLKPAVQKGVDWAAKKVAKSAVKRVYVRAAEPWTYPDPTLFRLHLPATNSRFGNALEG